MKRIVSFLLVFVLVASVLISAVRAEDYTPNTESGWVEIDKERYYLKEDGTYQTGWGLINGNWYYFDDKGAMQTGWLFLGNVWYYLNDDGVMQTGWLRLNDTSYYLNEYGAMQTGWLRLGDNWYYLNDNGAMQTGWLDLDGYRYYFPDNGEMVKGWTVIDEQKYLFDNSGKCVEGAHTFVIDISKWQGEIDWDKLSETDVDAVILRVSRGGLTTENYGDSADTRFVEYIENLEKLNIPYGVYHFNTATTVEIARIQAQNVVGILKETGAKPTYPVFADIETNGGECDLIKIAKVYMETFIENGYMPGIYANQNYWKNYLNDPELCAYYRWIANYGINNGYPNDAFSPDDGIENYMMWQYTSVGKVGGITENTVDLNALFDWYKKPDGTVEINGKKFIYSDGYFKYGWLNENGNLTYLKPSGEMAVGWLYVDNYWYYFNEEGIMQTGWSYISNSWYYLNSNGTMHIGWLKLNNTWYYLNENGAMKTGWLRLNDTWYYLDDYGAMQTGWLRLNDTWYYLNNGGDMHTGWLKLGNNWYYLSDGGPMVTGWLYLNNTWYYLEQNGVWTR